MKWKTIESAPTNGTVIDLWLIESGGSGWRAIDCHWDNKLGWVTDENEKLEYYFAFEFEKVSHWMPAPESPSA